MFEESARTRCLETAWTAYLDLCALESMVEHASIVNDLHRLMPVTTIRSVLRAIHPRFGCSKGSADEAARSLYMYTKLLNYLLLVSKLQKAERNDVVVLRLAMGQCMRRLVDAQYVQSPEDARSFVRRLENISASSSQPLRLTLFDLRMLILGAWKSQRHLCVPYLYQLACRQWKFADVSGFRRLSAVVLSFYVREYTSGEECVASSVITGILEDLNQRAIGLSPHHYSMLILYFGKIGNMSEALKVLERAMDDPAAQKTEAIYYNTFRAVAYSLSPRLEGKGREQTSEDLDTRSAFDDESSNSGLDYIDDLDIYTEDHSTNLLEQNMKVLRSGDDPARHHRPELRPEHMQAARICSSIFQTMVSQNVPIGFRTYRELIHCMAQFGMLDKARKIFEFAIDSLSGLEIKAHLIDFFLRQTTNSPHHKLQALNGILRTVPGVYIAMQSFDKRTLVDQFCIFDGNLPAFADRRKRPVVEGRGGQFLSRFINRMYKAKHAASFFRCMAAGNDPRGQFAGYNFLPLHSDGSGLAAVEAEVVAACLIVSKLKPKWLRNANVIYSLLPVLPGIARDENEPESMCLIRRLVGDECANVSLLTALLDKAGIEDYDIGLINQFMRVRYLGLTFQQYAKEKVAAASLPDESLRRDDAMFWPSFMYAKSNGGMLRADASQAGLGRDGSIARSVLAAAEGSWVQLAAAFRRSPSGRHSPDENTIGILSLVSIRASGWEFGQRLWSDVFRLAGDSGGSSSQPPLPTRQPLHRVRVYKHYVYFLTMAALAARREKHVFGDDALADMFLAMDRGGVEATSGLLCQIIRAGFEAGLIDVSSALEQWQLHRERCGLAPPGFLHQYFAARGLPEIPAQLSSMLGLIQEPVHCPRLSGYISHQMRMLG